MIGEKLIEVRGQDENWDEKTQHQARQTFALFNRFMSEECKIGGLASLRQNHLASFVIFLRAEIYKHYGKSSKDEFRTIKELRKIAESKKVALRGIVGETLNRHLGAVRQLIKSARAQGVWIDSAIDVAELRAQRSKVDRARDKRPVMPVIVMKSVFQKPAFTGCAEWNWPYEKGDKVYHRALYYGPMLLHYEGARREEICGLEVDDVVINNGPHP